MAAEVKCHAMRCHTKMGDFKLDDVSVPAPAAGQVRVKVMACGICHSDVLTKVGAMGCQHPRSPGHEIAGVIDALGEDIKDYKVGERVGAGWVSDYCGKCVACRGGDTACCSASKVPGLAYDGGYSQYVLVPVRGIARIPDELTFVEAAPLMCAGITTFNSLRHSVAKPGDVVAIVGVGGLGHLALQFANKMGFVTVAVSRGDDKKDLAIKLGAHHYIDSKSQNVGEELSKLGGAKVVMITATSSKALEGLLPGLAPRGQVLLIAALHEAVPVDTLTLLMRRASVTGWASGDARDSEDTMKFAVKSGIRAMVEEFPIAKANEAFNHMMSNNARFRVVLTHSS